MNKNVSLNNIQNVCFFDIETVGQKIDVENNRVLREFVAKRSNKDIADVNNKNITSLGGLYPETAQCICISVGVFKGELFHVKSYYGDNEIDLLKDFSNMISKDDFSIKYTLAGHNIESFDVPFLAKRYLLNGLQIPRQLNVMGKQSWDLYLIDTQRLWSFGDNMNRVSLKVLCEILNVASSKDDIDGSEVAGVYYDESVPFDDRIKRISTYCMKDVVATARVFQKITMCREILKDENVKFY